MAIDFDTWNGSVWVVVTTGTMPMADVRGSHPRRHQDRVEPSPDLVGPLVELPAPRRLQGEGVLNGHEVEQAALGLLDEVDPVAGREELGRPGVGLAPGRRMPTGAVQRDGEVERWGRSHGSPPYVIDYAGAGIERSCIRHARAYSGRFSG